MCTSYNTLNIHLNAYLQCAQNAQLLACRLSQTPTVNQIYARCVPHSLEERLTAAREIIDIKLDHLADFRRELNCMNDVALQHILVLQNLRDNFLTW
jgi:hypothetical protein